MSTDKNIETKTETAAVNPTPSIQDPVKFAATINDTVRRLATKADAWNTDTATELFVTTIDEYYAQLEDPAAFDAGDLRAFFARYVNLNAVYNRLKAAKLITGGDAKPKLVSDLL